MQKRAGRPWSWILSPSSLIVIPVIVSAAAWAVPGESGPLRGFDVRAPVTAAAIAILVAFYALCSLVARAGTIIGRKVPVITAFDVSPRSETTGESAFETNLYYVLTALTVIGVGYVVLKAGGPSAFIDAMVHKNANTLKAATGGAPGIATLRYTAAIAAPIGIHRLFELRRGYVLAVANLGLLLVTSIVASRLSLMMAVLVLLYLFFRRPVVVPRLGLWVAGGGALISLALVGLNFIRNGGFYAKMGAPNPFSAALYQGLSYVGAPFQASLGMANLLATSPRTFASAPYSAWGVLIPSIFTSDPVAPLTGSERYFNAVDVYFTLSTNSAFADTLADHGIIGLALVFVWIFAFGALFGWFSKYGSYVLVSAGASLYCFIEFWRLLLMSQGVAIFTVSVALVVAPIACAIDRTSRRPKKRVCKSTEVPSGSAPPTRPISE